MSLLAIGLYAFLSIYALWVFYLAVMNLKRARDAGNVTWPAKVLGYPLLFIGLALDAFVNVVILTPVLLELPKRGEWLVTARLSRHIKGQGWRQKFAQWICAHLLDAFDPSGCHCD